MLEAVSRPAPRAEEARRDLLRLTLGALGVVYGDIGTSPLYAVRECFHPAHQIGASLANVLGVISLVFWALTIVVGLKYLLLVMRADNHGEGGILALLALLTPRLSPALGVRDNRALVLLAIFGTSLLFADGIITPAISVLSAVEGLGVTTPRLQPLTLPLTLAILLGLFLLQRRGTAGVAALFGPVMATWFLTIAALGLSWVVREPAVLAAVNPWYAVRFMATNGWHGFLVLGAVVLVITGAEALYADMGHFGPRPIRLAWLAVVMPALLLNYFGQGALLISRGEAAAASPFFELAPALVRYPLVLLATVATVIASQALISGSFSLAQQAVQLGFSPRLAIYHTSSRKYGQIYMPAVNKFLMLACPALVLIFRSSSELAAAYGIAVVGTMSITTILLYSVMRARWGWSVRRAALVALAFLFVDLSFLTANLSKLAHGGLVPLIVGGGLFIVFTTWKRGRRVLREHLDRVQLPIEQFTPLLPAEKPLRVKGTGVFLTPTQDVVPQVLLHHFKHNKVLHEKVVLLSVVTLEKPEVPEEERVRVRAREHGLYQVTAYYGFMQTPQVPAALRACRRHGLDIDLAETSYYLGRETLLTTGRSSLGRWRKSLFAFLSRNSRPATAFFGLPANRVVELGTQIEI